VATADLVLLHNKANDAQGKKDPISVDIFDKIPEVKREFLKFCKPFEARLRRNVQTHRVIPQVVGLRCGTHCILDGIYCC
jgi:hypothetical protein